MRRLSIPASALVLALGAAGSAFAGSDGTCQCKANGNSYDLNSVVCIRSGSLSFLARCEMVLNNTAWKKISDSCPYTSNERASEPVIAAAETQMCEPARWLGKTKPLQSPVRFTRVSDAVATE